MDVNEIQKIKQKNFRKSYFVIVALFYLFQGFYQTSLSVYQAHMLNEVFLLSVSKIALVNFLVILPNYLKMFTGLLSDRVPIGKYRRVPYILIGTVIYVPSFILLANIWDYGPMWIITMLMLSWGWALVDGTLDALSIDVTPDEHLGMMNGAAWAARSFGSVVASVIIASIALALSWKNALYMVGVFAVLQGVSALLIKEPKFNAGDEKRSIKKDMAAVKTLFQDKQIWLTIAFVLLFNGGPGIYSFIYTLFYQVAGITTEQITIKVAGAFLACMAGVLIFGKISDKKGARRLILPITILFWASVCLFFFVKPGMPDWQIWVILAIFGFAMGGSLVPAGRLSMEVADPEISGFVYSGLASVSNLAQAGLAGLLIGLTSKLPGWALPLPFFSLLPCSIAALIIARHLKWWEPEQ